MSTVTFTSGIHVGQRPEGAPGNFIDWFAATTTAQFSTFSLQVSGVQVLTSVQGRVGDRDPVLLRFGGGGLPSAYNSLSAVAARGVLNGAPRVNISDFRDAAIRSGFLVNISMQLEGDAEPRPDWGILTNVQNSVAGGQRGWSVEAIFHPCDAAFWIGTRNWFLTPTAYASLAGES